MLYEADLQNANLSNVNFKGAYLHQANLEGADLKEAIFDEETVLPDGRSWSEGTDISRFTDPYHDNFWRPDDMSWLENDDASAPPWWLRDTQRPSRDY